MVLLIVTLIFDYVLTAVLVGMSAGAAAYIRSWDLRQWKVLITLVAVFAFLDLYYLPGLAVADIVVTIRNPAIAEFLEVGPDTRVNRLLGADAFDAFFWATQAVVARYIALKVKSKVTFAAA